MYPTDVFPICARNFDKVSENTCFLHQEIMFWVAFAVIQVGFKNYRKSGGRGSHPTPCSLEFVRICFCFSCSDVETSACLSIGEKHLNRTSSSANLGFKYECSTYRRVPVGVAKVFVQRRIPKLEGQIVAGHSVERCRCVPRYDVNHHLAIELSFFATERWRLIQKFPPTEAKRRHIYY